MHHFHWLFSNSIPRNILDTGTSKFERYSPREKILDNVEQSSKKYNPALYMFRHVGALHGSHVFCLSSHVIRNLNWKYFR